MSDINDSRIADALSLVSQSPPPEVVSLLAQRKKRLIIILVAGTMVCILVGVVVGFFTGMRSVRAPKTEVETWRVVLGYVFLAIGAATTVTVLVNRIRSGEMRKAWRSPLLVLNRAQRADLVQQVRGRRPVNAGTVPLARYLATQLAHQWTSVVLVLGLSMIFVGQAVTSNSSVRWVIAGVFVLGEAVASFFILRDVGAAERFLKHSSEVFQ